MVIVNKSKVRVSVLVRNTQGIMILFLLLVVGLVGGIYLFILNHMAFRGYVLQKQVESQKTLEAELSILETQIAKIEARDFLKKNKQIKQFATYDKPQFFVQKDSFTAQKPIEISAASEL